LSLLLLCIQIAKLAAAAAQAGSSHRKLDQPLFQGYPVSFMWQQIMKETSSLDVRRPVSDIVSFAPVLGIEQPTLTAAVEGVI
jgi:hypothetical protein